jgi:Flp pilus assembly protein CpaB
MIGSDARAGGSSRGRDSERTIRIGQRALRMLRRRHRWVKGLAIAVALLTLLSAVSVGRHEASRRAAASPAVVARHAILAGEPIRRTDVGMIFPQAATTSPRPFERVEDVIGRVAARGLNSDEPLTPENTASPVRYYGVAARVPRGMRAVSLLVPAPATFGGELVPQSRVDLLAAFELGQERAAATLLTSGIVLRISPERDTSPAPAGRLDAVVQGAANRPGGLAEVVIAVPEGRERDVALAQTFGRLSLAVQPLSAEPAPAGPPAVVNLRKYLNLPALIPGVAVLPAMRSAVSPSLPGSPGVIVPPSPVRSEGTSESHPRNTSPAKPAFGWSVEVITGAGERSVEQVPLVDDRQVPNADSVPRGGIP